jgi:flagellar L-ring protein precursor FlgH
MTPRWILLVLVGFAAGCGPAHIGEYTPKHREYKLPTEGKGEDEPSSPGSLWRDGRPASMLFTDARALHANDLVVINIEEVANASRSTDTNMDRSSSSSAKIVVMKVLSNGNLFVEGHRAILVNSEEHHFYISGVVRPIDIDQLNSIKSSVVADAQIEFVGRGDLTDNQKQGWLSRHLGWIWPF